MNSIIKYSATTKQKTVRILYMQGHILKNDKTANKLNILFGIYEFCAVKVYYNIL
jgi:hypothetical protein